MAARAYLGQALALPLVLRQGAVTTISDKELIEQSIVTILNTPKGSRFFLPEFGSRLKELMFEPNDTVLQDLLRLFIFEAMREWEKRAQFVDVKFSKPNEESIDCEIKYRILQSNEIDSFVFPFYKKLKY